MAEHSALTDKLFDILVAQNKVGGEPGTETSPGLKEGLKARQASPARELSEEEVSAIERRKEREAAIAGRRQQSVERAALRSRSPVISSILTRFGRGKGPQNDPAAGPGVISARGSGIPDPTGGGPLGLIDEPIEAFQYLVKDEETGQFKRYVMMAKNLEQVQALREYWGIKADSPDFTDRSMALASQIGGTILDEASPYVDKAASKAIQLLQSIPLFDPTSGVTRQLEPGLDLLGLSASVGRADRLDEKQDIIEEKVPGSKTRIVTDDEGERVMLIQLRDGDPWIEFDAEGFPIGGEEGSKLAELQGDVGLILGEFATAQNLFLAAASIALPSHVPARLLGRAITPIGTNALTTYMKTAGNNLLRRGLAKWAYLSGGIGLSTGFGNLVDNTIEEFRGFQHDDWAEIMDEFQRTSLLVAGLDGGLRGLASATSWFVSAPIKKLLRMKDQNMQELLVVADKYGIPLVPSDMHSVFKAGSGQRKALSSREKAFLLRRDIFTLAALRNFTETAFGPKKLTQEEAAAAVSVFQKKMLTTLGDETSVLSGGAAVGEGLLDYAAANARVTFDKSTVALGHEGASNFSLEGLVKIRRDAGGRGVRFARKGVKIELGKQPVLPDGRKASFGEATLRHPEEPISSTITKLFGLIDEMNPKIRTITPPNLRQGERSSAVDQMVKLREKAFTLKDDATLNDGSRGIAADIYDEVVRVMLAPVRGSNVYKAELANLSTYMDGNEGILTGLWAKRLLDRNTSQPFGEAYEIGQAFFNLRRPELIRDVKKLLTQGGDPAQLLRWQEARLGFDSKLLSNPADFVKTVTHPDHQQALKLLYSGSELKLLSRGAVMLEDIQKGALGKFMKHHMTAYEPAAELWMAKDLNGFKILMEELGGPESPQGRALASSFFSMLISKNTVMLDGIEVLNNNVLAKAVSEMRTRGWLEAMVGKDQALLMDIKGVEHALNLMVSGHNLGNSMITASTASKVTGSILNPGRFAMGMKKWLAVHLASRLFNSPFMYRASGLRDPRYLGSIDGKYLVPPTVSYLRLWIEALTATHETMKNDANEMGFTDGFHVGDIPFQVRTDDVIPEEIVKALQSGGPVAVDPSLAFPGAGALGIPNATPQAAQTQGQGQQGKPPPPTAPQIIPTPERGVRGGLPTNIDTGVKPGPRPKLAPR